MGPGVVQEKEKEEGFRAEVKRQWQLARRRFPTSDTTAAITTTAAAATTATTTTAQESPGVRTAGKPSRWHYPSTTTQRT